MTPDQKELLARIDSFDSDIEKCLRQLKRARTQFANDTAGIEARIDRLTNERRELITKLGRSLTE